MACFSGYLLDGDLAGTMCLCQCRDVFVAGLQRLIARLAFATSPSRRYIAAGRLAVAFEVQKTARKRLLQTLDSLTSQPALETTHEHEMTDVPQIVMVPKQLEECSNGAAPIDDVRIEAVVAEPQVVENSHQMDAIVPIEWRTGLEVDLEAL